MALEHRRVDDFTTDWARGGPIAWLQTLRANPRTAYYVAHAPDGWLTEDAVAALVAELDSQSPAASVCFLAAAHAIPAGFQSTVGREAAILISAFRDRRRYPGNCSDLQTVDAADAKRWWAERRSAPAPRPAAGVTIDESRTVTLIAAPPRRCVAVALGDATVYLDRSELERSVAAKPASWATEPERLALIAANRAQRLLDQVSAAATDADGCSTVAGALGEDARHVVLSALERGRAAARVAATGASVASVRVRYQGDRCGPTCGRGSISVYLADAGSPFLVVGWWVS